jgi:hypothetical protein
LDAITSTPASQYHACVVKATGIKSLPVKFPGGEMYDVCKAAKFHVAGPVLAGRNKLTAKSASGGTSRSTESLSTTAPGGIAIEG